MRRHLTPSIRLRVGLIFVVLLSGTLLTSTHISPLQASALDSWPTFHHDAANTGFAAGTAPHNPKVLWNFTTPGGGILSSPVVSNGTVYFGSENGYVYALNQSTGSSMWRKSVVPVGVDPIPTFYKNSLLVSFDTAKLTFRLNATNGNVIWSTRVGGTNGGEMIAVNDRVYIPEWFADDLVSLSFQNGSTLWAFNGTTGSPTEIAYANGIVYEGTDNPDRHIYALNASTGLELWNYQLDVPVFGGLTIAGGVVYGGSDYITNNGPGSFVALNMTTGAVIWKQANRAIAGPPAVAYGRLFLNAQGAFEAVNQTNGDILWTFYPPLTGVSVSVSIPAVADGLVFFGGGDDATVYALDALTGKVVWSLATLGSANSSPAISNSTIYIGSGNINGEGVLYAIGEQNAERTLPVGTIILSFTAVALLSMVGIVFYKRNKRIKGPTNWRFLGSNLYHTTSEPDRIFDSGRLQ